MTIIVIGNTTYDSHLEPKEDHVHSSIVTEEHTLHDGQLKLVDTAPPDNKFIVLEKGEGNAA